MLHSKRIKKIFSSNEWLAVCGILLCTVVFTIVNPEFFTLANLFSLTRAGMCNYIFALGCLLVTIAGGTDMSFMAIGSLSMYCTVKFIVDHNMDVPIVVIFLSAAILGFLCGLVNLFFVYFIHLPAFIVTLGTQNLFKGFVMAFIGTRIITNIPDSMTKFSMQNLLTARTADGNISTLHSSILLVAGLAILTSFILRRTTLGRNVYAVGGDATAAQRAGINLLVTYLFIFGFSGALAGVGGVLSATLIRSCGPADLVGNELLVIAAVVLGGGDNATGKGSVFGTILGVTLLTIIGNSLTLLRVPSYYQQALTGIIIIAALILQRFRSQSNPKKGMGGRLNKKLKGAGV